MNVQQTEHSVCINKRISLWRVDHCRSVFTVCCLHALERKTFELVLYVRESSGYAFSFCKLYVNGYCTWSVSAVQLFRNVRVHVNTIIRIPTSSRITTRAVSACSIMAELKHPHIVSYHDSYYLQEGEFSFICIVQVTPSHQSVYGSTS